MTYDPPATANSMDGQAASPVTRDEKSDYGNTVSERPGPWSSGLSKLHPLQYFRISASDQFLCQSVVVCIAESRDTGSSSR